MDSSFNKKGLRIDPRTLFFTNAIFCIALLMVTGRIASHSCFMIAGLLMIISKVYRELLKFSGLYIGIILVEVLASNFNIAALMVLTNISAYLFCKVIPMLMITSIIIKKVKINEIITALEKFKIPRGIILGIVVSFRFVPTIKYEFQLIKESMKIRGIDMSPFKMICKPIKAIEFFLVPLLFRCLKIAEELTATALTRGVENNKERTAYFDVRLSQYDWLIMTSATIVLGVLVVRSS